MKTVVITGSSSGIGEALVSLFHKEGYKVAAIDIKKPRLEIRGVEYYIADVSKPSEIKDVTKNFGHIDLLINNAAVQYVSKLVESKDEHNLEMILTNTYGPLVVTKYFSPLLKGGLIINVGSVHSRLPREEKIPYDMSKAALNIFTKETALELSEQNTRAICVEFGAVDTPMNEFSNETEKKEAISKQVIPHLMSSEECANFIYSLTKDEFKYLNGETIRYDSGRHLK